jgi:phosphoribosylaminoimidazole-succinocarboxamide synthase
MFTPTTKAEAGHDLPLSQKALVNLVGSETALALEEKSIMLYKFARDYAIEREIIIADTKFEFGFHDRDLILIDELLTPDSSRSGMPVNTGPAIHNQATTNNLFVTGLLPRVGRLSHPRPGYHRILSRLLQSVTETPIRS